MKQQVQIRVKQVYTAIAVLLLSSLVSINSIAQDKKVDIDINTKSDDGNFFMKPWVWIVAGAVFILLLVALLRGRSKD